MKLIQRIERLEQRTLPAPLPLADYRERIMTRVQALCEAAGEEQQAGESLAETFARANGMTLQELKATVIGRTR